MTSFDSIRDHVRELIINHGCRDCTNTELIVRYWEHYQGSVLFSRPINVKALTPAESITRARRALVREAKRFEEFNGEQSWTKALIPGNERLEVIKEQEERIKRVYS